MLKRTVPSFRIPSAKRRKKRNANSAPSPAGVASASSSAAATAARAPASLASRAAMRRRLVVRKFGGGARKSAISSKSSSRRGGGPQKSASFSSSSSSSALQPSTGRWTHAPTAGGLGAPVSAYRSADGVVLQGPEAIAQSERDRALQSNAQYLLHRARKDMKLFMRELTENAGGLNHDEFATQAAEAVKMEEDITSVSPSEIDGNANEPLPSSLLLTSPQWHLPRCFTDALQEKGT